MEKEIEYISSIMPETEIVETESGYYRIFIPGCGTVIFDSAENDTFFIRCRSEEAYHQIISKLGLNKKERKSVTLIAHSISDAIDKVDCKDCDDTFCPLCNRGCKGQSCILYSKSYVEKEVVYHREQDERTKVIEYETNIGVCGLVGLNN